MSRKLAYNKKRGTFDSASECRSNKIRFDTQSEMKECHIFIAITNKVRSNKMIAMYRRTFIIKVLFFIFIPPFFLKIGGRHSHQMFLSKLYNKCGIKTSKQAFFLPFVTFFPERCYNGCRN